MPKVMRKTLKSSLNQCLYELHHEKKIDFRLWENKGADQLRSNCKADQRLCFR